MRFKTTEETAQFNELATKNPALYAMALAIDGEAKRRFQKDTLVTSIYRQVTIAGAGDTGIHAQWSALDLRIDKKWDAVDDLTQEEWGDLVRWINTTFRYGRTLTGKPSECAFMRLAALGHHKNSDNDHVHVQKRPGVWG